MRHEPIQQPSTIARVMQALRGGGDTRTQALTLAFFVILYALVIFV